MEVHKILSQIAKPISFGKEFSVTTDMGQICNLCSFFVQIEKQQKGHMCKVQTHIL